MDDQFSVPVFRRFPAGPDDEFGHSHCAWGRCRPRSRNFDGAAAALGTGAASPAASDSAYFLVATETKHEEPRIQARGLRESRIIRPEATSSVISVTRVSQRFHSPDSRERLASVGTGKSVSGVRGAAVMRTAWRLQHPAGSRLVFVASRTVGSELQLSLAEDRTPGKPAYESAGSHD